MIKANDIEMVKLGGMTPEERERYEKNKIEIKCIRYPVRN